jgi:hypothetical protein
VQSFTTTRRPSRPPTPLSHSLTRTHSLSHTRARNKFRTVTCFACSLPSGPRDPHHTPSPPHTVPTAHPPNNKPHTETSHLEVRRMNQKQRNSTRGASEASRRGARAPSPLTKSHQSSYHRNLVTVYQGLLVMSAAAAAQASPAAALQWTETRARCEYIYIDR